MLLKSQEPHHNLSTCKTSAKTQGRISSSICSRPEPKAPPSSNLGPEEQKSDSSSHSPSKAPAPPPELPEAVGAHHLWQCGAIHHQDRSHSQLFRQCEHLVTFQLLQTGNEFESGPKKR